MPLPDSKSPLGEQLRNTTEWMVIPRDLITFDGSECDKVALARGAVVGLGSVEGAS